MKADGARCVNREGGGAGDLNQDSWGGARPPDALETRPEAAFHLIDPAAAPHFSGARTAASATMPA